MTDNRELLNDEEVDFLLQGAESEDQAPPPALDDGQQTVTMHGDLEQIRLADIFQTLAMSKMEGVLRLRNPLEERQVYCADGFVRILVPPRLSLRRLGQRLIQSGMLQPEELRSALLEQRKAHVPLGELLVRDGLVEQEQLDEILGMQVAEDLFALFTWKHGSFEFFRNDSAEESLRTRFAACPEYEINSLLLEVARRSDEWLLILEQVQSLDEVPICDAEPDADVELEEAHEALLAVLDGLATYRQLADRTTCGLFEFARAARDLWSRGVIRNLSDHELVTVAEQLAAEGERQRAVVLLQTLRDREGDRDMEVIQGMARVLKEVGERRFAGEMLLTAAQRTADAGEALVLGRGARELIPHDARVLHFLRSVLLAHPDTDADELNLVVGDLLDALIDDDHIPRALEILAEHRAEHPDSSALLLREARARQKSKDADGAVTCLVALAELQVEAGERAKAVEAYEAALRLDPKRKDVTRSLAALQRTRAGTVVRWAAAAITAAMVGAMGFVWLDQHQRDTSIRAAMQEVTTLLDQSDRVGARRALARWHGELGDCEAVQDLSSRVSFAEAADAKKYERERRAMLTIQMSDAAEALGRGEVRAALELYEALHAEPGMAAPVEEIVTKRLLACVERIRATLKKHANEWDAGPSPLLSRVALQGDLARLEAAVPTALLRAHQELSQLDMASALPAYLAPEQLRRLRGDLQSTADAVAALRELAANYAVALERSEAERRLSPLFQEAVAREERNDFRGALELYRELERAPAGDPELRAHFRDRATKNATITRCMAALAAATDAGDYAGALQKLRFLRREFPEINFDPLVQLPLEVTSLPHVAQVYVDGVPAGNAPRHIQRSPAEEVIVQVRADGFDPAQRSFRGDGASEWSATLTLTADHGFVHSSAIGAPPCVLPEGDLVFVDRAGSVFRATGDLQTRVWSYQSGDLSGFLSRPVPAGPLLLVASIDGTLRALKNETGEVAWEVRGLASELPPVVCGDWVAVATSNAELHLIRLTDQTRTHTVLGPGGVADVQSTGEFVVVTSASGEVTAWGPALEPRWRVRLDDVAGARTHLFGRILVVADDQGHLRGVDVDRGKVLWRYDTESTPTGLPSFASGSALIVTDQDILVVAAANGSVTMTIAAEAAPWTGEVTGVGARLVCSTSDGAVQVMDRATGRRLYQLEGDRGSRLLATGGLLFIVDPDHQVRSYGSLR